MKPSPCDAADVVRLSDPDPDDYPILSSSPAYTPTSAAPRGRFVAGLAFFNYNDFGSLRPGQQAIKLFTPSYIGLAVHVVLIGFVFNFFTYGYGSLLSEYLKANGESEVKAASYMLQWPPVLAIVIGLFSDTCPILGYRRKSYMVLGWVLSCLLFTSIIFLDLLTHSGNKLSSTARKDPSNSSVHGPASKLPVVYLVVTLLGGIAVQIAWISALIASVEYAQREHIHRRGRLQATLLSLYCLGGVIAKTVNAFIISDGVGRDRLSWTLSLGHTAIILAGVCLLAIPFVVYCFDEEPVVKINVPSMVLGQRLSRFWKFCHYNVVYRVLFFIGLHMFLLEIYNKNVQDSVQEYSKVSNQALLYIDVGRLATQIISTLAWKHHLRNVSWRKLAFWGSLLFILLNIGLTLFATYDVVRSVWFHGVIVCLAEVPRAWIILYAVILATEITEIGHEGLAVTLGLSLRGLSGLADFSLGWIFPKFFGLQVSKEEVQNDSASTRHNVTIALFIGIAFNLLSFALITLPPRQKLDAQQMRAFGGHNRLAGWALVATFIVLVGFNLAANLIAVL